MFPGLYSGRWLPPGQAASCTLNTPLPPPAPPQNPLLCPSKRGYIRAAVSTLARASLPLAIPGMCLLCRSGSEPTPRPPNMTQSEDTPEPPHPPPPLVRNKRLHFVPILEVQVAVLYVRTRACFLLLLTGRNHDIVPRPPAWEAFDEYKSSFSNI